MAYIYENQIEQEILNSLENDFGYDVIRCPVDKKEDLNDGTNRSDKRICVLPQMLKDSLYKLNKNVPKEELDKVADELSAIQNGDIKEINYNFYKKIRNGIKREFQKNGENDFEFVRLIDFENPQNNSFVAVSQMWIRGQVYWRRPDVLVFVNGLPLVFVELKNSNVKIQEAYNDNLTNYKKDIPNLFAFNQVCVLSNARHTKLGAFGSKWEFFFDYLKENESDDIDKKEIENNELSVRYFLKSFMKKERLIDYIENFIIYENHNKIIAKNHQFLGVNNLFESTKNKDAKNGKLGVFWHTQGSGKSYSMVMYARKVARKMRGNFTFLIITDREELDHQIYKNFQGTEVIGDKEECQPKNSEQLREYLKDSEQKRYIFTLIHKFRPENKGEQYPVLSERDDIIVIVDEAHRTQYKDLAENMRRALPNASFVAFTGTPLLGVKKLTNQYFGDYVSEYNFKMSVDDGSTVPLYYSRRVPEVWLENEFLNDNVLEVIEEEELNEKESELLIKSSIIDVIKRDERLEKVAKDIAYHFLERGYLGKAMVVCVDKFSAVSMYDKVKRYLLEKKKELTKEQNKADEKRKEQIARILDYANKMKMAVVISQSNDEKERFAKAGLDITPHREEMERIDENGKDIEDRFKDIGGELQLVFVCAMWLTGFDVKDISTLYLDKPMKGHTLMQAIARANRVYGEKTHGLIVDYINVFKYMKEALGDYASGNDGSQMPLKDIEQITALLDECIDEIDEFLLSLGYDLGAMMAKKSVLDKIEDLDPISQKIIEKDESKNRFKVLVNTLNNLHEASKPEIFEIGWKNAKLEAIKYLGDIVNGRSVDNEKIQNARDKLAQILDRSVGAEGAKNPSPNGQEINLSKLEVEKIKKELKNSPYKATQTEDLKAFIEEMLEKMIKKNCSRVDFAQKYKQIIDDYNAGNSENEEYYDELMKLINELKEEDERAGGLGESFGVELSDEELEIYDLLMSGKKLSRADEKKVVLSAKSLYKKLKESKNELFVVDWYKDEQPKTKVKNQIIMILDKELPQSYDKDSFNDKVGVLMTHFMDMSLQHYGWVGAV